MDELQAPENHTNERPKLNERRQEEKAVTNQHTFETHKLNVNSRPSLNNIPANPKLVLGAERQYSLRKCTLIAKNRAQQTIQEPIDASEYESESSYDFIKTKKKIFKKSTKSKTKEYSKIKSTTRKRDIQKKKLSFDVNEVESEDDNAQNGEPSFHDIVILNKLPQRHRELTDLQSQLNQKLLKYKRQFFEEEQRHKKSKSDVPELAIPISADVTMFNFDHLARTQMGFTSQLFDVIMMDPPWQLSTSHPSRGVAIAYQSLNDDIISGLPIPKLQSAGFLFIWVINVKYSVTCKLMEKWGYKVVDEIAWIKKTVTGKIAKGHGFYLQHAKETCLVGVKVF